MTLQAAFTIFICGPRIPLLVFIPIMVPASLSSAIVRITGLAVGVAGMTTTMTTTGTGTNPPAGPS